MWDLTATREQRLASGSLALGVWGEIWEGAKFATM